MLNLFAELLLALIFVELLADLRLLLSPVLEVFDLLKFIFTALGINLILNGILGKLLFDPLVLINLEALLPRLKLRLLLL